MKIGWKHKTTDSRKEIGIMTCAEVEKNLGVCNECKEVNK